jgi:hypothetical protein
MMEEMRGGSFAQNQFIIFFSEFILGVLGQDVVDHMEDSKHRSAKTALPGKHGEEQGALPLRLGKRSVARGTAGGSRLGRLLG